MCGRSTGDLSADAEPLSPWGVDDQAAAPLAGSAVRQESARQDRPHPCAPILLSTAVANDAWLSDLLRHGALSDAAVAQELAATFASRDPSVDAHGIATRALLTALEETWERGWQPADVVHVARREATTGSVPLVVALIAEHARRSDATSRAPQDR